jgi:hypothetical protein
MVAEAAQAVQEEVGGVSANPGHQASLSDTATRLLIASVRGHHAPRLEQISTMLDNALTSAVSSSAQVENTLDSSEGVDPYTVERAFVGVEQIAQHLATAYANCAHALQETALRLPPFEPYPPMPPGTVTARAKLSARTCSQLAYDMQQGVKWMTTSLKELQDTLRRSAAAGDAAAPAGVSQPLPPNTSDLLAVVTTMRQMPLLARQLHANLAQYRACLYKPKRRGFLGFR